MLAAAMGADDAERLHQHGGKLGDDRVLGRGAVFAGAQPVEHPRPMHGAVAVIEQPEAHAGGAVVAIFDRAHELIVVIGLDRRAGFARDNVDGVEARKRVAQFLVQRDGRDRLAVRRGEHVERLHQQRRHAVARRQFACRGRRRRGSAWTVGKGRHIAAARERDAHRAVRRRDRNNSAPSRAAAASPPPARSDRSADRSLRRA